MLNINNFLLRTTKVFVIKKLLSISPHACKLLVIPDWVGHDEPLEARQRVQLQDGAHARVGEVGRA